MTPARRVCTSCGAAPSRDGAKYCDACGDPLPGLDVHTEYKQVTVLFADVVRSMDIAATLLGYAAIGEQVGLAQRMESAAPPGGVLLSEATARLVEYLAVLAEPECVHIKGAEEPVVTRQLMGVGPREGRRGLSADTARDIVWIYNDPGMSLRPRHRARLESAPLPHLALRDAPSATARAGVTLATAPISLRRRS